MSSSHQRLNAAWDIDHDNEYREEGASQRQSLTLTSKCNDSASAPLDMLRHLDKDTVRRKGAQMEEKDLHLPDEWVFPKPQGICEPVWAMVGDNDLPASKRTHEPVYAGAQEAESKKSLVDDPVAKRTRSSRTRESVDEGLVVVGPVNLLMGQSGPAKVLVVKKRMIRRALISTTLFPKILNRTRKK